MKDQPVLTRSIRWRLPLTYAGIAVLATLILGAALLATLRSYYAERERMHLENNALAITESVNHLRTLQKSRDEIAAQLQNLAFITQARVRVFDPSGMVLIDTGSPSNLLTVGYAPAPPVGLFSDFTFDSVELERTEGMISDQFGSSISIMVAPPEAARMALRNRGQQWTAALRDEIRMTQPAFTDAGVLPPINPYIRPGGDAPMSGVGTIAGAAAGGADIDGEDIVYFAVASTPYGFDLIGEVKLGVHSDQIVRHVLTDDTGAITGYIELSEGVSFGAQIVENVAIALIFAGGAAILIAAVVGTLISRTITTPVLSLTHGAGQMAIGDLTARVHVRGQNEFRVLAQTFNEMAAQVEATILALRRFVADAAHELHTPLTALRADLELATMETDDARRLHYVACARTQVMRMESLTNNLLDLSRIESKARHTPFRPVDLARVIHDLSEAYASRAEQVNVQFEVDTPNSPLMVMGDELQLRRAVANLLDNAIKFTPEGGTVTLTALKSGEQVIINVEDTGIGIPPDDLPRLFARFHRGRNANTYPGSGLGLAIIRAIVDGHGGDIAFNSHPGCTQFTLFFPRVSDPHVGETKTELKSDLKNAVA